MLHAIRKFLREADVNGFLAQLEADGEAFEGFDFVERVLDGFNAGCALVDREIDRIPSDGAIVLQCGRAPGLLEACMLLSVVRQTRSDVRLVANDRLLGFRGLRPFLIPAEAVRASLENREAVLLPDVHALATHASMPLLHVSVGRTPAVRFRGLAAFFRQGVTATVRIRPSGKLIGFRTAAPMPVARPEDRLPLRRELQAAELLGATSDGKKILLFDARPDSAVLRELGRLREVAFRQVGEGTGKRRDIDAFDASYRHVVLWDDTDLQIVGAYRLGEAGRLLAARGERALYTHGLFTYGERLRGLFPQALELGRSFVQPRYQGLRALDYLWHGIGAYLRTRPEVRFLFGPVSLSAALPEPARRMVVHFFEQHFRPDGPLACARNPYRIAPEDAAGLQALFPGEDYTSELRQLKERLSTLGTSVPVLYKQYSELCEPGGTRFLAFNVDPAFSNCVDGLVWVDLHRVKPAKRARYMSGQLGPSATDALRKSA